MFCKEVLLLASFVKLFAPAYPARTGRSILRSPFIEFDYTTFHLSDFRETGLKYRAFPSKIQESPYLPLNPFLVIYELIRIIGFLKRRSPIGMGPNKQKALLVGRRA
jgi:hypothetical protein